MLDLTSLTVDELWPLVPPFEAAFQAHMADWRLDGKPRTARRYTTDQNCPLPKQPCQALSHRPRHQPSAEGGCCDLVMEVCCALHNYRVRLLPWQPMV